MRHKLFSIILLLAMLVCSSIAKAQLPVEWFVSEKRSTYDLMFFRKFQGKPEGTGALLYFNRVRMSLYPDMDSKSNLPQFGATQAISYNPSYLHGFAPVAVLQVTNRALQPKVGLQFAHQAKDFTLFSWAVATLNEASADHFLLLRYTPDIAANFRMFIQAEFFSVLPLTNRLERNFVQRFRLGLQRSKWQAGLAYELNQIGRESYRQTQIPGLFIRHEF